MRDRSFLAFGSLLGAVTATTAIPAGVDPLTVSFTALLALFVHSIGGILFFSSIGWPVPSLHFDIYDVNRLVISATLTATLVSLLVAATFKVATLFSLGILAAGLLALSGFIAYGAATCAIVSIALRR